MFDNYKIDSWQKGVLYLVTILVVALLYFLAKKKVKYSYRILIGLGTGLLVGLLLGQTKTIVNGNETTITATIRPIGTLYLRLITMVVMPLVFTSIVKSFTTLEDTNKLKKLGVKTLFGLLATTAVATIIGFLFAYIPKLGTGFGDFNVGPANPRPITPIEDVILGFFPNNIFSALSGSVVIPVVTFAIFVAVAIIVENRRHPERTRSFLDFNNSLNEIMIRITKFILRLTPYAVYAFIAYAVGRNNVQTLKELGLYILLIHGAMLFHFIFVQMGLLLVNKISPIKWIKNYYPAMILAFTTQSSYGTMPVSIQVLEERVGVSNNTANFVVPLGANIGMNACGGIFPAMVAVITAHMFKIEITLVMALLIVLTTTISSIGIAGVPGIATIAATVTLAALGLPLEGLIIVAAVDPLVDMTRTMVNVVGAAVTATLVAKSEGELNMEIFNQENKAEQII